MIEQLCALAAKSTAIVSTWLRSLDQGVSAVVAYPVAAGRRTAAWWGNLQNAHRDGIIIAATVFAVYKVIEETETCTAFFDYVGNHPELEIDAMLLAGLLSTLGMLYFSVRRWLELKNEVAVRKVAEARANELAYHDALTGLYNRRALLAELNRAHSRSQREGIAVSLLALDLDRFKPVNDLYGHTIGDLLLTAVAERLRSRLRSEEFLARLGGDEFAVVITHPIQDGEEPGRVAARLVEAMNAPFVVDEREISLGLTIGIARFPGDAETSEQLLRAADTALYHAKSMERGHFCYFEAPMDERQRERSQIELELRQAIAADQIVPFFQPLVDLKTGDIVGFEALARWHHPVRGLVSPAAFIPVAEECGLINDLSLSILRQGCQHALKWDPAIGLSINLSPVQFSDKWLAEKVLGVLVETGFPASRLEVEITENTLVKDLDAAIRIVTSLKNQGVRVSIDDFGAGYSSLQHLSVLPFDKIKIDRSFIIGRHDKPDGEKIVSAIVGLGKSLGLPTTGEGIENKENAEWLLEIGCTFGQGWHFGRPVPADGVAALLQQGEEEQDAAKLSA